MPASPKPIRRPGRTLPWLVVTGGLVVLATAADPQSSIWTEGLWERLAPGGAEPLDIAAAAAPMTTAAAATIEPVRWTPAPSQPAPAAPTAKASEAAPLELPEGAAGLARLEAADLDAPPFDLALFQPEPAGDTNEIAAALEVAPGERQVVVQRGDTLFDILARAGIAGSEAQAAVTTMRAVYDPRRLRPGQALALAFDGSEAEGGIKLAALSLDVDPVSEVELKRGPDGAFEARTVERPLTTERAYAAGEIEGSLYASAAEAGIPPETLAQFAKVFSWDIDFQRDIHKGDGFEAVFERLTAEDGTVIGGGQLLYAAIEVHGKRLTAFGFERDDGGVEYYDADGRPLRKWLLRTPVDGARLSSTFGPRKHPILGYTRMHKGIDFAVPAGTPIYAAGDGVVEFAGRNSGYGNYVRIRHNGGYSSAYAHMSRFARGLAKGDRVRQGQVIGYVGSTGLATGPHLHYEILQAGKQINPLSVKTLDTERLAGAELRRFKRQATDLAAFRKENDRERTLAAQAVN